MDERRRKVRVLSPVLVEFPSPGTMKTARSFTQDVSESGMRFPTGIKLDIGQQLPLTLQLPFHNVTLHAMAEVMWIRVISRYGAPQYEIGVRFLWVDDPDRQRMVRHLASLSQRHA